VVYLAEAAARVIIAETTSTSTALAVSRVMPYAVAAVLVGWMVAYGRRAKREGERLAAAQAAADAPAVDALAVDAPAVDAPAVSGLPATTSV